MRAERPISPGGGPHLPNDMYGRVQAVIALPGGIPLAAGQHYYWRLDIDGRHRKSWRAYFYMPNPPPQPVVGGPAGQVEIEAPGIDDDLRRTGATVGRGHPHPHSAR